MAWEAPTTDEFKEYFARDFRYAPENDPDNPSFVMDADITRAITEAQTNFNSGLADEDHATIMFMYLAAHYLVLNLRTSGKGINSQGEMLINSKGAGSVSVGYQIPDRFSKSPILSQYTTTGYGMKYLELSMKYLVGRVSAVEGTTTVY